MSKDRFSKHSSQYAAFRPTYPSALYEFIFRHVKNFESAWDAGTGNGQVARDLSTKFLNVFATDISQKQIDNAWHEKNIKYSLTGEATSFANQSFDLITVAQAIHWFDRSKFYNEVKRVAKPNAVIAVWGYELLKINSAIDPLIGNFYTDVIGSYWDKERKLIDEHYTTIDFPFSEIESPEFSFSFEWTLDQLQGYLTTWSSVQKFIDANGLDPVEPLIEKIRECWPGDTAKITFPLFLRLGRVN